MKYAVLTFGCRVNQADSLGFEEDLLARGAVPSAPEDADVVVVNTCSVTSSADQAARQTIRRLTRLNPEVKVVATGCYATRRPDELAAIPGVRRVIGNDRKPDLIPLLWRDVEESPTTAERFGAGDGACGEEIRPGRGGRTAYTLRLQTGCAQPCSYCIIPSTRGAPRSVDPERVVRELDRVVAAGFKEVALTGVHLGSYGRDLTAASSFTALMSTLVARQTQVWPDLMLRVSSLEPMDCTPDLLDTVAASPAVGRHFHLPLQHASDAVLSRMRRPYTFSYYASLVNEVRRKMPDAAIGSDIIVGFPGETDADLEVLLTYLERSPLTHLHVFPYSDRPGTEAAGLSNKVAAPVIRERAQRVREVGAGLAARFRQSQIGTSHRALTIDDGTLAVTGNYLKVRIAEGRPRNEWVTLRVGAGESGDLRGEIVD